MPTPPLALLAPLALALSVSFPRAAPPEGAAWDGRSRVVHEWGTFTSVQGSSGSVLDGLTHHDRDLPPFVYDLTKRHALTGISPKMETPVIYFYAPEAWRVAVDVRFPRGIVTEWFPAATRVNGAAGELGAAPEGLGGGFIAWGTGRDLCVLPPGAAADLPAVEEGDPWRFSRDVAANPLYVCNLERARAAGNPPVESELRECERFLFYRGLGDFDLPLAVEVRGEERDGGRVRLALDLVNARPEEPLTHVFAILVEGERSAFVALDDVAQRSSVELDLVLVARGRATADLERCVATHLERTGLFADEARAMARTWAHAWFGEPGLRLLYVLPRELVERELPLAVRGHDTWDPERQAIVPGAAPDAVVRTFVGRTEVLTPTCERLLERTVRRAEAADLARREAAEREIAAWGRYALPYLERVLQVTRDEHVAGRARREIAARRAGG